jgi:hypothetical protein
MKRIIERITKHAVILTLLLHFLVMSWLSLIQSRTKDGTLTSKLYGLGREAFV